MRPDLTDSLRRSYDGLFSTCEITPARKAEVEAVVRQIDQHAGTYREVTEQTGVPWFVVGAIHAMEASCSFRTHLHNGDPLSARTVHTPVGRPPTHEPPFTWAESAVDALRLDHLADHDDWAVATMLYRIEGYNGWGYHDRGVPSPYLWSFSNHYTKGKYGEDGHYDPDLVSKQPGAAVILHLMAYYGEITFGP